MPHIALITKNHVNPAYGGAVFGARAVAAGFGYEVRHTAPQKADDIPEQAGLIREALAGKAAAIVLLPAHDTKLAQALAEVKRAGVPLVTLVGEAEGSGRICHVGSNDVVFSREVAAKCLAKLPDGAEVAIMDGHPDSINTPPRRRGFEDALGDFPKLRLVAAASGYFQQAPAREEALRMLAKHPKLAAVLVANDLMAMGILQAMQETGRKLLLVSINGTPEAVTAVGEGRLLATASFNTLRFGCLGAEAAARYLRGEQVPHRITLPADIIDAGNWKDWDKPYEARPRPDWAAAVAAHGEPRN